MLTPCCSLTDSECPSKIYKNESESSIYQTLDDSWHRKYFEENDCPETDKSFHSLHCKSSVVSLLDPPIEIQEQNAIKVDLPSISWHGYDCIPKILNISNTGRTTLINGQWTNGKPLIKGGPLNGSYMFSQIHFHCPSEHEINGTRYPLEMHVVHYKTSYLTQERAMEEKDGTVVLVYLFKVKDYHETALSHIARMAPSLQKANSRKEIPNLPLNTLVKPFCSNYYVYWGSIKSEKKSYLLQWIISCTLLDVTSKEVDAILNLLNTSGTQKNRLPKMKPENSMIFHVNCPNFNSPNQENFATLNMMNNLYESLDSSADPISQYQNHMSNNQQWPNLANCLQTMEMSCKLYQNNQLQPNSHQWMTNSQKTPCQKSLSSSPCPNNPYSQLPTCPHNTTCITSRSPPTNSNRSRTNLMCSKCLNASPSKNFSPCQTTQLTQRCPQCTNTPPGPYCPNFSNKPQNQLCSQCAAAAQGTFCSKCRSQKNAQFCSHCTTILELESPAMEKSPSRLRRFFSPLRSASSPGFLTSRRNVSQSESKKKIANTPISFTHSPDIFCQKCSPCPKCSLNPPNSRCPKCSVNSPTSGCPRCFDIPSSSTCPKCSTAIPYSPCPNSSNNAKHFCQELKSPYQKCCLDYFNSLSPQEKPPSPCSRTNISSTKNLSSSPCSHRVSQQTSLTESTISRSAPCSSHRDRSPCTINQSSQTTPQRQASPLAQPESRAEKSSCKETTSNQTIPQKGKKCICPNKNCLVHQSSKTSLGNSHGSYCSCSSKEHLFQKSDSKISYKRNPKKSKKSSSEDNYESSTKLRRIRNEDEPEKLASDIKSTPTDSYRSSDSEENISTPKTKKSLTKISRRKMEKSENTFVKWDDSPKGNEEVANQNLTVELDKNYNQFLERKENAANFRKEKLEKRKAKSAPSEKSLSKKPRKSNKEKDSEKKDHSLGKLKTLFSSFNDDKKGINKNDKVKENNEKNNEDNNEMQVNFFYTQSGTRRVFSIPTTSQSEPEPDSETNLHKEKKKAKYDKLENSKKPKTKENEALCLEINDFSKDVIVNTATLASSFAMPRDKPKDQSGEICILMEPTTISSKDKKEKIEKGISVQNYYIEVQKNNPTLQDILEKIPLNRAKTENSAKSNSNQNKEDPKNLHILVKDCEIKQEPLDSVSLKLNLCLKDSKEENEIFNDPEVIKEELIFKDAVTQYSSPKCNTKKRINSVVGAHQTSQNIAEPKEEKMSKKEKLKKDLKNKRKKNKKNEMNENSSAEVTTQAKDLKFRKCFKNEINENRPAEVLAEIKNFGSPEKVMQDIYANCAAIIPSPPKKTKPREIDKNKINENQKVGFVADSKNSEKKLGEKAHETAEIEEILLENHLPRSTHSNSEIERKNTEEKVIIPKNERSLRNLNEKRKKIVYFMYDKIKRDPSTGKKIFVGSFRTKEELEARKRKNIYHNEQSNSLFSASRMNHDKTNWIEIDEMNSEKVLKIQQLDSEVYTNNEERKPWISVNNKHHECGIKKNMFVHKFTPQRVVKDNNMIIGKVTRLDNDSENFTHLANILEAFKDQEEQISTEKLKKICDDSISKKLEKIKNYKRIEKEVNCDLISTTIFEKFMPVTIPKGGKHQDKRGKPTKENNSSQESVLLVPVEVNSLPKVELFLVKHSNSIIYKRHKEYIPCLNCYK